jgi:hypothetical protein
MVTNVLEGGPLDGRRVDADVAEGRPVDWRRTVISM